MNEPCRPIECPPQYCVRDVYIPRVVPYVHPVVIVTRENIVNVPHHIYQPCYQTVVNDPGYPTSCC